MTITFTQRYQLYPFWDDEYKRLNYIQESFNDPESVSQWVGQGYPHRFIGDLCDMRHKLPNWSRRFIEMFEGQGWQDIGLAFYRMKTGTVLPVHSDLYKRYIEVFDLQCREHTIHRALVFLEDWKPGHYFEVNGAPTVDWRAGSVVEWVYDTPHMAANIGLEDRYTLQITGHVDG
jgi:hypothetical protein